MLHQKRQAPKLMALPQLRLWTTEWSQTQKVCPLLARTDCRTGLAGPVMRRVRAVVLTSFRCYVSVEHYLAS